MVSVSGSRVVYPAVGLQVEAVSSWQRSCSSILQEQICQGLLGREIPMPVVGLCCGYGLRPVLKKLVRDSDQTSPPAKCWGCCMLLTDRQQGTLLISEEGTTTRYVNLF